MIIECLFFSNFCLKNNELGTLLINSINDKIVYIQISIMSEAFSVKFCASSKAMIQGSLERIFLFANSFVVVYLETA